MWLEVVAEVEVDMVTAPATPLVGEVTVGTAYEFSAPTKHNTQGMQCSPAPERKGDAHWEW